MTLQYCTGLAIHQLESTTGIHVFPILNPPPSSLPVPSLWVVPVNQPQASSVMDWCFISYMILYMFQFHSPKLPHPLPLPQAFEIIWFLSFSLLMWCITLIDL